MEKVKNYIQKLKDVSINRIIPIYAQHLTFDFLDFYIDNFKNIDKLVILNKGDLAVDPSLLEETEDETLETMQFIIASTIINNQEKYKHLFALNELDYNPIHNYDGTETTITEYGAITENGTDTNGERKTIFDKGEETETVDIAQKTTTATDFKNGYNSGDWTGQNKSETVTPSSNDSTTREAFTDTTTEQTSIDTTARHIDTHTDTVTIEKGGNLGVTTTQQMMTQEEEYWSRFNASNVMMNDIISALTLPYFVL